MRVISLIVALAAITFVSAAPVGLPNADAAPANADWKREADAEAGAPAWKREAEADASRGAPAWKREAYGRTPGWKREPWGRTASWKREADASEEKRDPRWGNVYTW